MKSRKPKDVNLKPYDMWTDEDYEAAIPEETRRAFDRAVNSPEVQELVHKMCSEKNEKYITQEEKELLIKDLYARLAYSGVQIHVSYEDDFEYDKTLTYEDVRNYSQLPACSTTIVKPYLRSLSSMTDEEEAEIANIIEGIYDFTFRTEELLEMISMQKTFPMASIDWFHEKGFDFRGLIPLGLALEAPEGVYNN